MATAVCKRAARRTTKRVAIQTFAAKETQMTSYDMAVGAPTSLPQVRSSRNGYDVWLASWTVYSWTMRGLLQPIRTGNPVFIPRPRSVRQR